MSNRSLKLLQLALEKGDSTRTNHRRRQDDEPVTNGVDVSVAAGTPPPLPPPPPPPPPQPHPSPRVRPSPALPPESPCPSIDDEEGYDRFNENIGHGHTEGTLDLLQNDNSKSPKAKRQLFPVGSPFKIKKRNPDSVLVPVSDSSLDLSFSEVSASDDNDSNSVLVQPSPIAVLPVGGTIIYEEPLLEQTPNKSESTTVQLATPGIEGSISLTDSLLETPNDDLTLDSPAQVLQDSVIVTDPQTPNHLQSAEEEIEATVTPEPKPRSRSRRDSSSPTRKRKRDESLWKRNVSKKLKNSGQAYISSRGKEYEGAKMREPCACALDCVHRITQDQRLAVHEKFWRLGQHERQWDFIRINSKSKSTVARPENADKPLKRTVSRSYSFTIDGEPIKICKQMFMRTLGICDSWIESAHKKINSDKGFTVSPDKRGRHTRKATQITPVKIESVKQHVNLFPRVPSHYCRKRTKREYLERGLSISKMATLYNKWAHENNLPQTSIATKRQYRDILNDNFNIGFFKPKKDQCSFCCLMRNKSNTRQMREERKDKWVKHLDNKKKSRALKDKDKTEAMKDKTIAVCSFDLQKQLTCPKSEDSAMFYRSKLNVYNFTVFNHVERMGSCFLWHEGIGKKGSSEISSSLIQVIRGLVKNGYSDIRFYSDNCAGQNKNRFLFSMYLHLCVKYSIKITHRYLEPGHTQMEADSIHANIERSTEKTDIYEFDDWVKAIEGAKQTLPKYKVKLLSKQSIFSYKDLVSQQNWEFDFKRQPIRYKKIKEIFINGAEGSIVRVKYDYDGDYVTFSTNKRGRPVNLKTFVPPLAREGNVPLSALTVEHLTYLLDNMHIPLQKQTFLRNVLMGINPVAEEQVSDVEYDSDEEMCQGETEDTRENQADTGETNNSGEEDGNLE